MSTDREPRREAAPLRICAEALRAGRALTVLSIGLSIVAAAGIALSGLIAAPWALVYWSLDLALGVVAQWIGYRVAFDARLFARLADEAAAGPLDLADFDAAMQALHLLPISKAGRPVDVRCRGALRLLRVLSVIVVIQAAFVAIAGAAMYGAWSWS